MSVLFNTRQAFTKRRDLLIGSVVDGIIVTIIAVGLINTFREILTKTRSWHSHQTPNSVSWTQSVESRAGNDLAHMRSLNTPNKPKYSQWSHRPLYIIRMNSKNNSYHTSKIEGLGSLDTFVGSRCSTFSSAGIHKHSPPLFCLKNCESIGFIIKSRKLPHVFLVFCVFRDGKLCARRAFCRLLAHHCRRWWRPCGVERIC